MSLVEAIANVAVGYGVAVTTQSVVFPWFGLPARIADALAIGAIFTVVSITRSFALWCLFEAIRVWGVVWTAHLRTISSVAAPDGE